MIAKISIARSASKWLETNGRGGFASGTLAGANTRRYHALLSTARKRPTDRYVLVNHIEEWVHIGSEALSLSINLYPGAVHPNGYTHCTSCSSTPWPTWIYACHGKKVQREILCVRDRDVVIVRWKLIGAKNVHVMLRVRPMLTGREYHGLHHENGSLSTEAMIGQQFVIWSPYDSLPAVRAFHTGTYRHAPDWYRHVQFSVDQQRGLDCEEDWWSPGEFLFELEPGKTHTLTFTSESIDRPNVTGLLSAERSRRGRLRESAPATDQLAEVTGIRHTNHEAVRPRPGRWLSRYVSWSKSWVRRLRRPRLDQRS